jgi:hypothetical protein
VNNNHRDNIFFSFGLILNSGIDIPDLFNIFLKDFLRFLFENGFWLTIPLDISDVIENKS